MDRDLLEDLKKQDNYAKFFKQWKEQNFHGEIDEKKFKEELSTLSKTLGMNEGVVLACFDYRNLNVAFFTGNVESLTGYPEELFRQRGMETTTELTHPDDRAEFFRFQQTVFDAFYQLSIAERHTFEFSYTTRWLHRETREVSWMTSKARPYVIDELGNFVMDLHIIVQLHSPPKTKSYDWSYSFIKENGARILVNKSSPVNRAVKLTSKERQVADYMLDGKESKEIGELLSISINTVSTHRKKIFKKLGARNVGEMVRILASYDF